MIDHAALAQVLNTGSLRVHARKRMPGLAMKHDHAAEARDLGRRFVMYAAHAIVAGAALGAASFAGAQLAASKADHVKTVLEVPAAGTPQHALLAGAGAAHRAAAALDTKEPKDRVAYQQLKAVESTVAGKLADNTLATLPVAPTGVLLGKVAGVLERVSDQLGAEDANAKAAAANCRAGAAACAAPAPRERDPAR